MVWGLGLRGQGLGIGMYGDMEGSKQMYMDKRGCIDRDI